ncbi:ribonuclease YeeF family protein [Bacillus haynesii]|uniref:ribonuclease YeeF family protein n=1 Tax=Bacillus haynesii TaxID=1925021 RepID=UPI001EFB62D8|nr:LXG domain-containing protein [Bacillus haynesii]MCI4129714.1 LXG domain-containing protein [Bacillus haynesii]
MKTLDVQAFQTGLDKTLTELKNQTDEISKVKQSVKGLTSLDDALKGAGGEAIRSFYEECHTTFLLFYESFISDYKGLLEKTKSALHSLEPNQNGFISQSFLENELHDGVSQAESLTGRLTSKANQTMATVSHIVDLPDLDDSAVNENAKKAQRQISETLEKLHTFDREQTNALKAAKEDLDTMKQYIQQLEKMYTGPKIEISEYKSGSILKPQNDSTISQAPGSLQSDLQNPGETPMEKMLGRFSEKDEKGKIDDTTKEELPFEIDWMYPVSSAGSLYGTTTAATDFGKSVKYVVKDGVKIEKGIETNSGRKISGYKVQNGQAIGIKGKNYPETWTKSQLKAGNTPKIAEYTKASSAVKGAMKSKLGWAGVAITTGEDLVKNINDPNVSTEKTVGDVAVDVGVGAATLGVSAVVGAAVIGAGAPIIAAAAVGFVASVGVSMALGGIKLGKDKKSVTDIAKDTVESGLKTVAGWFK